MISNRNELPTFYNISPQTDDMSILNMNYVKVRFLVKF